MIPLVGHEPEGSAITVGDGAGGGVLTITKFPSQGPAAIR